MDYHFLKTGLTQEEALIKLQSVGKNLIEDHGSYKAWLAFLSRFRNPLIILLLSAAVLILFVGEFHSFVIITLMVFISVIIDFTQEHHATKAAEKLRQSVSLRSQVWRDGVLKDILAFDLVPGDIVELTPGDMVPADGVVLEARDFFIDEAVITGESFPDEKNACDLEIIDPNLLTNKQRVFMGTSVLNGWGRMGVTDTGSKTAFGKMAKSLGEPPQISAFMNNLYSFGYFLIRVTLTLVFITLFINLITKQGWLDALLFSIALGVGMTPEFLPMIMSVSLARGAVRLSKQHVIVKHTSAIYDLGNIDILCTDKTGTLTEAKIRLESCLDPFGKISNEAHVYGFLNAYFESGLKNPLTQAIREAVPKEAHVEDWKKIDELPFDFERRRVSLLLNSPTQHILLTKGTVETILPLCQEMMSDNGVIALSEEAKQQIMNLFTQLSHQGKRLLAVASKSMSLEKDTLSQGDESGLCFLGILVFSDLPKKGIASALRELEIDGIHLKVITGDNELVTQHLYEQLGLKIQGVLNGPDIQTLSDEDLQNQVEKVNIFCRITPEQKQRIIVALRANGHIVGFIGDGVNDTGALHAAHVGISVDNAMPVAKESSQLILMRQDFHVIHQGILEGRRTFANIMKYIMMGTSSNFGNMMSMVGASLFLPFLPMLPIQILLNNLLYDLSEVAIPFDSVDSTQLKKPSHWDIKFIRKFMLTFGPVSSIFDFVVFYIFYKMFPSDPALFQTAWFVESLLTQILVIFIIRTRLSPWQSMPDYRLIISAVACVLAGLIIPYSSFYEYFYFVPLPKTALMIICLIVFIYLVCAELVKRYFYKNLKVTLLKL